MRWYYVDAGGQQAGPVDDATFDGLIADGKITPDTYVIQEGSQQWQTLQQARMGTEAVGTLVAPPLTSGDSVVCAECGQTFASAETIQVGNARVCARCKPRFVQKLKEGMTVQAAGVLNFADVGVRFGAVFLDGILLYIVNTAMGVAVGVPAPGMRAQSANTVAPALMLGLFCVQMFIACAYETFMIGKYGATLGKMACKIKVVKSDGSPVGYGTALGRYFSKLVSSLICCIGYFMAFFDNQKRALHDRMCDTRVVKK